MNIDVAVVDLSNGYGGPGLALAHHLGIPAVGFTPSAPDAGLRESTVLKDHFSHNPNRFARPPPDPATLFERIRALVNKANVNWNVAKEHTEIDKMNRDAMPDSPPVSGKMNLECVTASHGLCELFLSCSRFTSQPERHADQRHPRVELLVLLATDFYQNDGSASKRRA